MRHPLSFYAMKDIQFMIKDWALLDGKPVKVDETNIHEDLQPIPLTSKTLLYSEFRIVYKDDEDVENPDFDYALLYAPLDNKPLANGKLPHLLLRMELDEKTGEKTIHHWVCGLDVTFNYVHQLQHAIRLMGYDYHFRIWQE